MVDSGTHHQSALESVYDNLEMLLALTNAAISRSVFWSRKLSRVSAGNSARAQRAEPVEWARAESAPVTEQETAHEVYDTEPFPVAEGEDEEFTAWLRNEFGIEVSGDSVEFVETPANAGMQSRRVQAWNLASSDDLREAFTRMKEGRGDEVLEAAVVPLLRAYHRGESTALQTLENVGADGESVNARTRVRLEDGKVVTSRFLERPDLLADVNEADMARALRWLGASDLAQDARGGWFPYTDDPAAKLEQVGRAAPDTPLARLSEAHKFHTATREEIIQAARAHQLYVETSEVLPQSLFERPLGPGGADGVQYREFNMGTNRRVATWVKDGKATRHPDGVPSVVMDENRQVVAAGHYDNGKATGQWVFTDPSHSFVAEKATLDPETGRARDVYKRESDNEPFARASNLDGAVLASTATTAAVTVGMKSAVEDATVVSNRPSTHLGEAHSGVGYGGGLEAGTEPLLTAVLDTAPPSTGGPRMN